MKVSINWIKEFVKFKESAQQIAQKLTMAGLEVGSVEKVGGDTVLEFEITANRPDCLSILGFAQEVAAVTKSKFTPRSRVGNIRMDTSHVSVRRKMKKGFITIADKKGCLFYRGCLIKDVKIGPSPDWLKDRLEALGTRSVNNVVDVTNYCLLEYGQPLHAFDYDKIVDNVIVRRAKNKEKILTIDGVERELDENILVISDKNKAIAVAGIIGDKLSEVSSSTKNILLESAYFEPVLIRKGSRQLGVSTESSYRFERQVDFKRVTQAQDRAVELLFEIANGKFVDEQRIGQGIKIADQKIKFDSKKANKLLSTDISVKEMISIFSSLGFTCKKSSKDHLLVSIPAIRRDIKIQEDLVEELARVYGYENIPSTMPPVRTVAIDNSSQEKLKPFIRNALCALGFNEIVTFSLLAKETLDKAKVANEAIRLINPLSSEQECLRPELTASLINCLAYNINHKNNNLKLFELSHIYNADFQENLSLGLIVTGKFIDNWQVKKDLDLFYLKGNVEKLLVNLGYADISFKPLQQSEQFASSEAVEIMCQNVKVGILGRIDKGILAKFGVKNAPSVFYGEMAIKNVLDCQKIEKKFEALPKFPASIRDISIVAQTIVKYGDIINVVRRESGEFLKNITLVDIYKGEQIPTGCMGYTIALEFRLSDRTLTDKEVANIYESVTKSLKRELSIQIR